MRGILAILIDLVLALVAGWAMLAFVLWQVHPSTWGDSARLVAMALALVTLTCLRVARWERSR